MKKTILLFGVLAFLTSKNQAQTNSIIIDSNRIENYVINIKDTLIPEVYQGGNTYVLDIDKDSIPDFTFSNYHSIGGMGGSANIKLTSSDSCTFAVDSTVIDTVDWIQMQPPKIIYDTAIKCSMVKKFEMYDTVFSTDYFTNSKKCITNRSFQNSPSAETSSLDNWIPGGDHYIGIKKIIHNQVYLGWIKVDVLSYDKIIIKEYALNTPFVNIKEYKAIPISVFPNPAIDRVYIDCAERQNLKMQVYNIIGDCVFHSILTVGKNEIDISSLTSGIYIIQLTGTDGTIQRKLIKN